MNKKIYPYAKTAYVVIHPEGMSDEDVENIFKKMPNDSFTLTESGKEFLNS